MKPKQGDPIKSPETEIEADRFRVTFVDGTSYHFVGRSATDLVLCPIFLKFFIICILIFAVLQHRSDIGQLDRWERISIWLVLAPVSMLWLSLTAGVALWLKRRGLIRSLYTPFISVTVIVFAEPALQFMLRFVLDLPPNYTYLSIEYLVQPMIVILLMDMLFGSYVAASHPLFVKLGQSEPLNRALTDQTRVSSGVDQDARSVDQGSDPPAPPNDLDAPEAAPSPGSIPVETLNFNGEKVATQDIMLMQIADHYLRVETHNGHILTRYKMSDAVRNISPEFGIQISRSIWIAKIAIDKVCRTPTYGAEVVMTNGNAFPVSRSRISGVLDTCNRWGIKVGRPD